MQRRASNTGVIMVAGQKIALGRIHAGRVATIHVAEHTLAIDLDGEDKPHHPADHHPAGPQHQSPPPPQGRPWLSNGAPRLRPVSNLASRLSMRSYSGSRSRAGGSIPARRSARATKSPLALL